MRVLIHHDHPDPLVDILNRRIEGVRVETCRDYASLPARLTAFAPKVMFGIRFAGTPGFPRQALLDSPSLDWISVGGSGTDHLSPWDPEKLTVTNAAGVASDMMAQYVIGAIMFFSLNFAGFRKLQRERRWAPGRVQSINGKTLLIVGLGKTGQDIARRAKAMSMRVIGVRATPRATSHVDEVYGQDELPALWRRADFIAVCVPLTDRTRGLVGEQAFSSIKPGALLVDVSRGGVVLEQPLLQALTSGRLAGAALDVFETEPLPAAHPLWRFDNVIITPHCSSVYDGWEEKSMHMFCDNLQRFIRGEPLGNVVDPARGY